jgi:hypothetical protein
VRAMPARPGHAELGRARGRGFASQNPSLAPLYLSVPRLANQEAALVSGWVKLLAAVRWKK